ncbi:MAG: glutathione peroxidase [Ferruginibacter sp.]|nr:glutathione peroxidase [Ferruginibacter sp.]
MTARQKILKAAYPVMIWFTKATGTNRTSLSNTAVAPIVPIYNLPAIGNDGQPFNLNDYRGKKILLVNTASDCGYTGQYEGLEKLYRERKENLVVLGFPANDFKQQEKGTDENIAAFCKLNFGVSFPLLRKSKVSKGAGQNEIFEWLTNKNKNGWNDQDPTWNFCKYLVDEEGKLVHFFASSVEPMSGEVLKAIDE